MTAIAYSFSRKLMQVKNFFPQLEFRYTRGTKIESQAKIELFAQTATDFTPAVEPISLTPTLVVGWGYRPTTVKARALAQQAQVSYLALEDGFIRSPGLGVDNSPAFSVVYDHLGIYYDLTKPSRLEELIFTPAQPQELEQASQVKEFILAHSLSKYNHAPDFSLAQAQALGYTSEGEVVLVVDQTYQDMAVVYGQAEAQTFSHMLEQALAENPQAQIWVKTHPDVLTGKKKGYFAPQDSRVTFVTDDCNPQSLLKYVNKVYVVTSQLGFEALLAGKEVVTFGACWYAGWGLTRDMHPFIAQLQAQGRRVNKSLLELVLAAYLRYPLYLDPATGKPGNIWQVLTYLAQQKSYQQVVAGQVYALDMSFWKRMVVKPFLPSTVKFTTTEKLSKYPEKLAQSKLIIWGQGKTKQLALSQKYELPVIRLEDGFMRSVGLGSNLVAPVSLVVDGQGIYFNSQEASALEQICQEYTFAPYELAQAQKLQQLLINKKIGKYNVGASELALNLPSDKTLILVPGQVEDDASLAYGSAQIKSNLQLLQEVRKRNPQAYIIYKPHPDVVSKNRLGEHDLEQVLRYADVQIEQANILDCIMLVDQVHTMTSLAGFEALLRGKQVFCYGLPFYAGWGLTQDLYASPRRQRQLTLEQLIVASLMVYPLYKLPQSKVGQFSRAEQAVIYLSEQRAKNQAQAEKIKTTWLAKQWRKLKQLYQVWLG
ncbi:capsular polysaccharide biosynthesis protein [Psittacicella gerlachiana]|uniref:Capsular polysaccharide export protein n=1 Tax=Psittacicella gerlachiana TaxID=2028574 RepID=A0A3A1YEK6_9GAMM|nr:capsular polysaccharide biosynthesis protein [Psittacicella gerlachiana]RIY35580.1 hypothetical protein CKF59_03475 [Psittacicella gerlachiana]